MRVYLDGRLIDDAGSTLGRAIDAARASAGDRMLVEVLADGAPVPAQDLDHPPADAPYASEIKFASADAGSLLEEAIQDVESTLAELRGRQSSAAGALQEGRVEDAIAEVGAVLDLWRAVKDALSMLLQAAPAGRYDGESRREFMRAVEGLAQGLGEVKRCMASQDWASLADCLAWDMGGHAERFEAWVRHGRGQGGSRHG